MHERGELASIEAAYDEITAGTGPLVDWAKHTAPKSFWKPDTAESLAVVRELATWANDPARIFNQAAVDEFMDSADLRLIAQAKASNAVIVTRERSEPESRKRIKIPDAARTVGVGCIQPFEAYQRLGLTLTS